MQSPPEDLPERLAAWRGFRKLSQKKLAVKSGCAQTSVASIELRKIEPSLSMVSKLVNGLDTKWGIFWSRIPKPRTTQRVKSSRTGARS